MKLPKTIEELLTRFETWNKVFDGKDPDPVSNTRKGYLREWQVLLRVNPDATSRTRQYYRSKSREFALKVKEVAGTETLMLCLLEYTITSFSKNKFDNLFEDLAAWSSSTTFSGRLKTHATEFWSADMTVPQLIGSDGALSGGQRRPDSGMGLLAHTDSIRNEVPVAGASLLNDVRRSVGYGNTDLVNDGGIDNFVVLEADDVPGLHLCLLQERFPQSVFELEIDQLIAWIGKFQSASRNPFQITNILECLKTYRLNCPTLRHLQLIVPWYGSVPYIDIRINSQIGCSAKVQLSEILAVDLRQYIQDSWPPSETADRNVS